MSRYPTQTAVTAQVKSPDASKRWRPQAAAGQWCVRVAVVSSVAVEFSSNVIIVFAGAGMEVEINHIHAWGDNVVYTPPDYGDELLGDVNITAVIEEQFGDVSISASIDESTGDVSIEAEVEE